MNASCGGIALRGAQSLFANQAVEALGDGCNGGVKTRLIGIHHVHGVAGLRKNLSDSIAHGSRSDNAHIHDLHENLQLARRRH